MVVVEEKRIGTAEITPGAGVTPAPGIPPGGAPVAIPKGFIENHEKIKRTLENHALNAECVPPEIIEKETGIPIAEVRDHLAIFRIDEYSVSILNKECGASMVKELAKRLKRCGY